MLQRIRLNGGHLQLSIEGHLYLPDDTGAFLVPKESAAFLIAMYGGQIDPGVESFEAAVVKLNEEIAAAKNFIVEKSEELKEATAQLDAYKKKQAAASDAKLAAAGATLGLPPQKPQQPNHNNQGARR